MWRNLLRLAGVLGLLIVLFAVLGITRPVALDRSNLYEVFNRHGDLGIITLGAALLIIIGGIDLSVGSVVGLGAITFGVLMEEGYHPYLALGVVLASGAMIGAVNGLLVTQLRLQAFLVTLCGMFVYRGIARQLTPKNTGLVQVRELHPEFSQTIDFLREWLTGKAANGAQGFPMLLVVLLILALVLGIVLHGSVLGRQWFAIGYNEQAARYAGIHVERQKILVFTICSTLAAFGGVTLLLFAGSADPVNAGNSYELYAITAAVLGGCSLRGGEGMMIGFVLGALVQPLIKNLMNFWNIPNSAEPWVIGLILLVGTIADEL
ncbi:MAG: ABC transporter permease, partial [Gemmataceae bacterium]